jgi:ankyrin repeat protein
MSDIISSIQEKLWHAAQTDDCAAIRALVLNGADLDARDELGRTALNIATQYGNAEAATTILAAKELNYMVKLGVTPEEMLSDGKKGTNAKRKKKKSA